ncbi:hypothetical protein GCM10023189_19740 [Nibrella saemangeumensis]|uniref:DUF4136 domain-containing protein n=2 Tax=Nibrella saemangeumensis TaxID=1084526 RepID=A0ABP8MPC8_9BACT
MAALIGLVVGGSLVSCRDNALDDLSVEDSQVFITNYDRSINFGQYRTYSLPDSVVVTSNDRAQPSLTLAERQVVNQVAQNLTNRGFQRVGRGEKADLGVAVIRVNNVYTGVTTNPYSNYYMNYWGGGFGPGFGPGLGGFYPYYQNYYSFYQVQENYWLIEMVDLKNGPVSTGTGSNQNQLRVIFQAQVRGDGIFDEQSVNQIVNAVFNQAPYLQTGQ